MTPRFYIPLLTCTFSILTVLTAVYAEGQTPTDVNTFTSTETVHTITGDLHYVGTGTPGIAAGLDFNNANAKFDLGAVISVTGTDNPVKITDSNLQLSWSGKKLEEQRENEENADFENRKNAYLLSDYGGFGGGENPLDVLVDNSTITFSIDAEEPERAWYIDSYNIHIDANGATANIDNEKGIVAARTIDDMVSVPVEDGETDTPSTAPSGGTFTKTGAGTLVIGGAWHDADDGYPESGLNISGTLDIKGGTVNLAGDRELAAEDPNGNATTVHYARNVTIAGGSVLDVSTGGTLKLTNEDAEISDIAIAEGGKLRIANSVETGIYNTEKNTTIGVDGGTVEIYAGNSTETLVAPSVDATLGEKGGTINVEDGVTFENRSVTGTGDYTKIGEGTHIINGFSSEENLIVTAGTTVLNNITEDSSGTFKTSSYHPFLGSDKTWIIQEAGRIDVSGTGTVLDITAGTTMELTHADGSEAGKDAEGKDEIDVKVADEGTLKIAASNETLLFHNRGYTNILNDGGTIKIYNPVSGEAEEGTENIVMDGSSINTIVGTKEGTLDIDAGVTLISGNITALEDKANVKKIGEGTSRVGNVDIGTEGIYDVQQGTAEFAGTVVVGSLKSGAGATINMVADNVVSETDEVGTPQNYEFANFEMSGTFNGGEHNVKVGSGIVTGETGKLTNIGDFTTTGTFDLGKGEHDTNRLVVASGTFDLKAGAWLQLTNTDAALKDMEVKGGTLKIASADGTGIFKKDGEEHYVPTNLLVDQGMVEIYKLEEGGKDYLLADNIHTTLGEHGGSINVAEGLTFESGSITGTTTGTYTKQGKGTHIINGVNIAGTMQITEGTTVLKSGTDNKAVSVVVADKTVFDINEGVSLELSEIMEIKSGSVVINNGTLTTKTLDIAGGTLQLQLTPTELLDLEEGETAPAAAITTDSLSVSNGGKITLGSEQLQLGSYTYENIVEVRSEITDQTLAELNKNQSALYRSVWGRSSVEDSTSDFLTLTMRQLTFDSYMNEIGWNQKNAMAAAQMIDRAVASILNQEAGTESREVLLSQLATFSASNISEECRAVMAGELVSDAVRMVMSSPHRMVFQQLNSMPTYSRTANRVELGQANSQSRVRFWFNPYAQSEEGDASENTFDGYSLTRVGFMLGGDVSVSNRVTLGVVFNYGNPNIDNDLGEVSANDYMVGGYAKMPLFWNINANAMIGYGIQQYTYEGNRGTSDFDGDSIFGSVEMVRTFPMMTILKWTPVIGLDFQSIGMDDLSVKSSLFGEMPIAPEGMDSVAVRVGLRGELMRFRTRVQYIRQVSGDDYMMSSISLNNAASTSLPGVQWGKDWVNVGLGGELIQSRNFRMFADYDLDISKNTTSHLGSISAVLMW